MKGLIEKILEQPSFDNETKASFLKDCVTSDKWPEFVDTLSDDISIFLFEKQSKILPINQYEEIQKKLNSYLNLNIDRLKAILISCSTVDISSTLAGRLVCRIAIKLFLGV